ncbi:MAG: XRE family transcriptional regulator [Candidatus Moranbacteria bacterium]|nr:XRE family transcriptional regulator [Candidatus Moranbacteria bacterium]
MKIHEKIKTIRKNLELTQSDVYERGVMIYGKENMLALRTIKRIENNECETRFSSLIMIACALGISFGELIKDTELEQRMLVRESQRLDEFVYNARASSFVLSSPDLDFVVQELSIKPGGRTSIEQSPQGDIRYQKCYVVTAGAVKIYVQDEEFALNNGDSISIDSRKPHYVENTGKYKAKLIFTLNPKHL